MTFVSAAEDAIKGKLRDPDSATFSDEHMSTKGGPAVACGYVNSKNGFGGMTGRERYISNTKLAFLEEEMAPAEMDQAWNLLC